MTPAAVCLPLSFCVMSAYRENLLFLFLLAELT